MFVIATYLGISKIDGIGVFAKEKIPAKSLVWEFRPGLDLEITDDAFAAIPWLMQDFIRHYGNLVEPRERYERVYLLCGDHARFMNHSNNPNISSNTDRNYALGDIDAGAEIVCDYRGFDLAFREF